MVPSKTCAKPISRPSGRGAEQTDPMVILTILPALSWLGMSGHGSYGCLPTIDSSLPRSLPRPKLLGLDTIASASTWPRSLAPKYLQRFLLSRRHNAR